MKQAFAWLVGVIICASMAHGGGVKVTVLLSTGAEAAPTTTFATDAASLLARVKTEGAKKGDQLRAVWVADDVGAAAPANTTIEETDTTLEGDIQNGKFSVSKPEKGWPAGKYHVEIYANGKLATSVKFTIGAGEKAEKASEEPADDDAQYTFKVHNDNVQRITKLLASEDGRDYSTFDIGEGIDVGETVTLNWDKSTNKSDCNWYIKAVYADKSVGEAVKFNFCEEDLVIDF